MSAVQEADFHTKDTTGVPMPKTGTYLRHSQVEQFQSEISGMEKMLTDPLLSKRIEDPAGMQRRVASVRQMLAVQSPPRLTSEQRDVAAKREAELSETIKASMCSQEEMRKCPAGAIGKFRKGEASPAVKAKILAWKNIKLMLNTGDSDPDLCNIEMMRPRTSTIPMNNALIPGKNHFVPPDTQAYRDGHDRTFGDGQAESPEVAALRAELVEMRAAIKAASQAPKAKTVVKKTSAGKIEMVCGKVIHGRGGRMHRRHCKEGCTPQE